MPLLLVAYEIHTPKEKSEKAQKVAEKAAADRRNKIEGFIKQHDYRKLSESSYAVEVTDPVMTFAETLLKMTSGKDELYVIPLAALPPPEPLLHACGNEAVRAWLRQRLRLPA